MQFGVNESERREPLKSDLLRNFRRALRSALLRQAIVHRHRPFSVGTAARLGKDGGGDAQRLPPPPPQSRPATNSTKAERYKPADGRDSA